MPGDPKKGADKVRPADDAYTDEEAARRTDATVRAMIGMRPKPRSLAIKKKQRGRTTKGTRPDASSDKRQ